MKFSCKTDILNKAIQTVQKAIASKPSTPIFSGIHIIALENSIKLEAMDLNMAISCTAEAEVIDEGEIVVSAKYFSEPVRKFNNTEITITRNDVEKVIYISSATSEFKLLMMNEDDFPKFPVFDGEKFINIEDTKLKELIQKTIYACSNDEARPLFTGILFDVAEETITCVGTNTHRLAIKTVDQANSEKMNIIVPSKVLAEIYRNINGDVPMDVQFALLNNQLMVVMDNIVIVSRLIEGKFPDYKRVIPANFSVKAKINIKEMANAVDRVSLFSSDGEFSIIKFNINGNKMTLSSSNPVSGTGKEEITCESNAENLNVAFNAQYMVDILKNIDAAEAIMSLNTSLSPVCISPADDESYIYIVTPVRVAF